jgi:hypothetical protein
MNAYWKLFTDCGSEKNAEKLLNKAVAAMGIGLEASDVQPYHKGGFTCCFTSKLSSMAWEQVPYIALVQGQKIGRMWIVSGDISREFSAWSNDSNISGVVSIQLEVEKNA